MTVEDSDSWTMEDSDSWTVTVTVGNCILRLDSCDLDVTIVEVDCSIDSCVMINL